jgi:hypothetical protein
VLAVVAAAGSAAYVIGTGSDRPAAVGADGTTDGNDAAVTRGVDGAFAFTVGGVECAARTIGPDELAQRAEGQFCVVDVSVRNGGTEAALLDPGAQRGVDGQGREHTVAEQAAVFLNERQPSLLDEIPPGATVHGALAFDVPAGERLSALVLRESMGSPGVRVRLS